MTTPNDPRYPGSEDPTENFGGSPGAGNTNQYLPTHQYPLDESNNQPQPYPDQFPGGGYHTSDPYAAYGNDTRSYPTSYGDPATMWNPARPGEIPPLEQQRPPGGGNKKTLWIALGAVVAVLAAIGIGVFLWNGNSGDDATSTAAGTTQSTTTSRSARPAPTPTSTPEFTIPDIPLPTDILNDIGLVSGTITSVSGNTLTIDPTLGTVTKVVTTDTTFVLTTSGTSVADLAVGQQITAQGDVSGDTLTAQFITDISIGIPN